MAEPDFIVKQHDTAVPIRSTLRTPTRIRWISRRPPSSSRWHPSAAAPSPIAGTAVIDQVGAGTAVGGNMGVVHYNWTVANVATADLYAAKWEVTFLSGTVQTFPQCAIRCLS